MTSPVVLAWKLRVDGIGSKSDDATFVPPEAVLPALAEAIGVNQVLSCQARVLMARKGTGVVATGVVRSTVVQICGVTLEPFESAIEEAIDVRFAPDSEIAAAAPPAEADGEEGSAGMGDRPEPIVAGTLDLGAVTQEFLALGVDPFPRKPGVAFEPPDEGGKVSPFAALERWRKPDEVQ